MRADVPEMVGRLLGGSVAHAQRVSGGDIAAAYRVTLAGGAVVFAKEYADTEIADAEAASLGWLGDAGGPVPTVLACAEGVLVLPWLGEAPSTTGSAASFGARLAVLHDAGAPNFGASWPGYAGRVPVANTISQDWAEFHAATRILPLARRARDRGALDETAVFDRLATRLKDLAGPPEPPSRLHGDLWSGNLLWTAAGVVLIDPAAYGGHRETDLAMLALFGAPHLCTIVSAYQEAHPLADGWEDRVPLHQLYPLLAHAVMFGGGYGARALSVARQYI